MGIGENGTRQEIAVVAPFLENANERICKAALIAYGNLAAETGDAVYWRFLSGHGPVLARQAYRLIQKYRIPYSAEELYHGFGRNMGSDSGECFLKLLLCAPSWKRLPYLLLLYCGAGLSEEWRNLILEKICQRDPYAKVPGEQARKIRELLAQYEHLMPQGVCEGIRFDLGYVAKER